ncbi:MAG: cation:proton antiporter [Propionibacteriaceae bacterium]|jgi:cell volume regulation protein A|nr:cation:proton antiporter [Propionibacteriaceae bacterium]
MLLAAAVLLAAVLSARLGTQLGLPSLLLFLGLGFLFGQTWLFGDFALNFSDAESAHAFGFMALAFILAEGGLTTRWDEMKEAITVAVLLASAGVLISIAVMAAFAYFVLGFNLVTAVLLGAITAPTDSAAVFSVLRRVPLPSRVRATLEAESGFNDAPIVLLVATATELSLPAGESGEDPMSLIYIVPAELIGGFLLGLVVGRIGMLVMRKLALPSAGLYPLAAFGFPILAYGLGDVCHVSGFAAVYMAAVVLSNGRLIKRLSVPAKRRAIRKLQQKARETRWIMRLREFWNDDSPLPHRTAIRSFAEGVGWVAQIGLFVMLGVLASDEVHISWSGALAGLGLGAFLTFVARPVSVFLCSVWFKTPWREQLFISWAGLRGAVPIIMATVPLAHRAPHSTEIFGMVFIFVIFFTLLQAPTLPASAKLLKITTNEPTDVEFEFGPLDNISADMLQVSVAEGSKLHGVTVREVRLPVNSVISLIVRADETFTPHADTKIQTGDELLVVTRAEDRKRVEARFKAVSELGRLANWRED